MTQITQLIDKQDNFEIIRDRIAQILADESAGQMALATADSRDPEQWRLLVYRERSIPWELLDGNDGHAINVWFDSTNVDEGSSSTVDQQAYIGSFNIDVVACAEAVITESGHIPADRQAALEANRIVRLCRNILMSGPYTYLGLRQREAPTVCVGKRWIRSINTFQPQLENKTSVHITGMRLELSVRYSEFSPQYQPAILRQVNTTVREDSEGRVEAGVNLAFGGEG